MEQGQKSAGRKKSGAPLSRAMSEPICTVSVTADLVWATRAENDVHQRFSACERVVALALQLV